MKFKTVLMAIAIGGSMLSCNEAKGPEGKSGKELSEIIGKADPSVAQGKMTAEVLHSFGRVGSLSVSPDRKQILYQVTYISIPENKSNNELFIMKSDGSHRKQLTITNTQESNAQWIDGGRKIAFLSNETGS